MIFAVLPPPMTKTKRKGINMKAKKHGTAVIFFETDLEKSTPFDEDSLSDLQKRTLSEMPKAEQEKIKAGYGASVIDIGSGGCICDFNTKGYRPPEHVIKSLAEMLLPRIKKFYEDPKNREKFEE